jgi:uncharacterized membrane protein YdbT with pleckstrin-like domain
MSGEPPGWVTLTEGEEVVWSGHPSLVTETGSILLGAVLVALGAAVGSAPGPVAEIPARVSLVGAGVAVLGALVVGGAYVRTRARAYVLTTEEAYAKRGLVSRTVRNVRLDRVQNTGFSQSFLQRLVGVGSVHLDTAGTGGTEFVLSAVPDPQYVNGLVTEQLDRVAGRRGTGGP